MQQDLLNSGMAWLAGQLQSNAATAVTYARGGTTLPILATFGQTRLQINAGDGNVRMEYTDRDFIVTKAALGNLFPPQRGDTVKDAAGSVYEVFPYNGEKPWTWCDPYQYQLRVRTKKVA